MGEPAADFPTPASQLPFSNSDSVFGSEGGASGSGSSLKWYKKVAKYNSRGGHPYELQSISLQGPGNDRRETCNCVTFWPFVGPRAPWKRPQDADWDWEEYEGTVALCYAGKLVVGRCTDEEPWLELWDMAIDDNLYAVAWTYHPLTCHPLLAAAGKGALIYLIDAVTKECIRTFRGHGDDILRLAFDPNNPHILASSSYDRTTRIWNILGTDPPEPLPGDKPNENFPMGDADEGNTIVAILAGEGKAGHQGYVTCAAFHPTKRAIATCGMDYVVKIWPLPPLPEITVRPVPTPRGYRPAVIHFPLFLTNRFHDDFLDHIDWLGDDVLVSRASKQIITWQWLGYRRYFNDKQYAPLSMDPPSSDYTNSSSYMVIARYPNLVGAWFVAPGIHHAFVPTATELESFPEMVTDPLIGFCAQRDGAPEILLYNPTLAEDDGSIPEPITDLRYASNPPSDDEGDADTDSQVKMHGQTVDIPKDLTNLTSSSPYRSLNKRNPSLEPWRLVASDWSKALRKSGLKSWVPADHATAIQNVAISPRGAKWIVGAGSGLAVFVWRLGEGK
ncbi:hypothetical protein CI109_104661 [Kwoniella shandongensis]|uniref:Uncharacterized protein n=1 Tax=Kwoniella shandongensis TaxID=1734106 RepID=A0A5M6BVD8_9TREE|nr:uncharacterized protein CI109_004827 [Kwoniella shandongensis]KAA5526827.1 hypothetical protein CI109_004827 [Kwoniella shandongensis]